MYRMLAFGLTITLLPIRSICAQYGVGRSGITGTLAPFLSTSTRSQAASRNLDRGTVNNLSTIPAPSGKRTERREKPQAATGFSPSELRDQNENTETNRTNASEGTAAQGMVSQKMPETIAVRYVSNGGSDANDGLSWGTAKRTIYGALVSLPDGGTNAAGSGTVYVGPSSSANPTEGAGIWLMGLADPSYATPPTGWLRCGSCILNIVGMANINGGANTHSPRVNVSGGSSTDRNHPGLWLSAVGGPMGFSNIAFNSAQGRSAIIGECSNNVRTGGCATAGVTLTNMGFGTFQTAANGPAVDITGASFWIWMRDCSASGNAYKAKGGYTADNAAAVLIDGRTNGGNGLLYINDMNMAGGGIKAYPGTNGLSLYVKNVTEEGDFSHPIPPVVWFTSYSFTDSTLESINLADPGPNNIVMENDGAAPGPSIIGSAEGVIVGPATVLEQYNNAFINQTKSPGLQRQTGFFNGYAVGETNVARRISGLVPARFPNNASTNTSTWTITNYAGTNSIATGQNDPMGGTGAAKADSTASVAENILMTTGGGGCPTVYTPAVGDWIIGGAWVSSSTKTLTNGVNLATCGYPTPNFTYSLYQSGQLYGDGQWEWEWFAYKVASGSATHLGIQAAFSSTNSVTAYGPVLYIIPKGALSDNEVVEFASSMNSVDSSCEVGQICNLAGHPVVVSSFGTLSNCSSVVSPAKCGSAPAGSFVLVAGSTTARVNTTAVTANSQILVIEDSSLGAKLGVSCNKTTGRTYMITDRAAGISFAITSNFAPTDRPACLSFQVLN
jgi:hypothetical protein